MSRFALEALTPLRNAAPLLALAALACGGCNSSEFGLAPVSGTVTLDGEPLAGGVINFQPQARPKETTAGPGSSARLDEQGRYQLKTVNGEPGAVVSTHKVKIYSYSPESPSASDTDTGNKEKVPDRYNYRTNLTFEVPAGGTESADFALTTAAE